jgi:hypothetical protein
LKNGILTLPIFRTTEKRQNKSNIKNSEARIKFNDKKRKQLYNLLLIDILTHCDTTLAHQYT